MTTVRIRSGLYFFKYFVAEFIIMKPKIEKINFGDIRINGKSYGEKDIILYPDSVIEKQKTHEISASDFEQLILYEPEIVVIGTGFNGLVKIDKKIQEIAKKEEIGLEIEKTPQALEKFEELLGKGKKVVAWVHTTC